MIRIRNLAKAYAQNQVLRGIDLTLQPGRVYGIVGVNGAGKTTLFRCLAGLTTYEGDVEASWQPLKNHLGFLPTQPLFLSRLTGWEYLKLLCVARGIATEDFAAQNIFDLPLAQYAENYSTGMKKKLALWGTLLQQNEVFILDEPYNGVDIQSNILITEIIHRLRARNKIVLIASHIFSTLRDTCDEIHLLQAGQLIRSVGKDQFAELDAEMKQYSIDPRIDRLPL